MPAKPLWLDGGRSQTVCVFEWKLAGPGRMSGVEEGLPGGQGAPWWTLGAGPASLWLDLSKDVDGGKDSCLPTAVRGRDARRSSCACECRGLQSSENSTPKRHLHANQRHQNLEFSIPHF